MSRPAWSNAPLYVYLCEIFPKHRTILLRLDVEQLAEELGKSQEAIYKWLRKSRLTPDNAAALLDLANKQERDTPLTIRDFDKFVYATA